MTATVRSQTRTFATVLVLALAATLMSLSNFAIRSASAAPSSSSYASRLTQLVNQARAQHGLRALTVASGTTSVAASWTAHLASAHSLSHNPNLISDVQHHGSAAANVVAENVGQGAVNDPDGLFRAYMNSSEHRANILDGEMRYLGMAVAFSGNYAWNTMDFVDEYSSGSSSSAHTKHSHTPPAPVHHRHSSSRPSVAHHSVSRPHHAPAAKRPRPAHVTRPAAIVHRDAQLQQATQADLRAAAKSRATTVGDSRVGAGSASLPVQVPGVAGLLLLGLLVGHVRVRRQS